MTHVVNKTVPITVQAFSALDEFNKAIKPSSSSDILKIKLDEFKDNPEFSSILPFPLKN